MASHILTKKKASANKLHNLALSYTQIQGDRVLAQLGDYEKYETDIGRLGTYYSHFAKTHKEDWRALRLAVAYSQHRENGFAEPSLSIIKAIGSFGYHKEFDSPFFNLYDDAIELFGYEIGIEALKTAGILYKQIPATATKSMKAWPNIYHSRYLALVNRYETVYQMKLNEQSLSSLSEDERIWLLENDYLAEDLKIIQDVKNSLNSYKF